MAKAKPRPITVRNAIHLYWHCRACLAELPVGQSPRTYARLSVGATPIGMQVWCERHDINVVHIDFEGAMHPAETYVRGEEPEGGMH